MGCGRQPSFGQWRLKCLLLLPERPFLCVGCFISEKNHALLLRAFRMYQPQGGSRPLLLWAVWPAGDEILGAALIFQTRRRFSVPFEQLEQCLRYAQAHALILPPKGHVGAGS